MSATLAEILTTIDRLWPFAGAESWDASGLVSGDPGAAVRRVRFAVDAVAATVDEAVEAGADLLITHHPLLLRGVTSVAEDRYKGALLARLIRADCALISAHTNADVVEFGTSAVLAEALGLTDVAPIVPAADPRPRPRPRRSPRRADHAGPPRTTPRRGPARDGDRGAGIGRIRRPRRDDRRLRGSGRLAARPSRGARRRRLHHGRPAPPSGLRGTRAGDARHAAPPSSTSRTGPASGSGSRPAPTSCAPPTPTSRSR